MSAELVAVVAVSSVVAYLVTAYVVRSRAVRARGPARRRVGGLVGALPYFVPVPYAVIALGVGPELELDEPVRWAGLALVVLGTDVMMWAALTLGRHFDVEVETHAGHEVVRSGPYALVRHPIYAGFIVHFAGACLASGNVLLMLGTAAVIVPSLVARARAEEALLRDELGAAYERYAAEVPMLVPFAR